MAIELEPLDVDIDMTISDETNINVSELDDSFIMNLGTDKIEVNGTFNYVELYNKPSINGVELIYDTPLDSLGVMTVTNNELEALLGLS
jgi:hypothetical protein